MKKKSLNVKKIILKNFNFTKILQDKIIFKIFSRFAYNYSKLKYTKNIAVAVSGGADSMALCFLISCYEAVKNTKINTKFYLVDHKLRKDSSVEALKVKKYLKLKNINLKILKLKGKKPNANIQSFARKKRYEILFNKCKIDKINSILTAHHKDDIYETFFSRLLRGSGTEGLSSFLDIEKTFNYKGKEIIVARPLLGFEKKELIYVSKNVFNSYVEDPSNNMEKFQRVRLRKLISNLKIQGMDFNKLSLTLNNLASTNRAINEIVNYNISNNAILKKNRFIISSNFFFFPNEVIFRSLSTIFRTLSKKNYPPRGKKMINLINELKSKNQFKATLGGIIVNKIHNSVVLNREKPKKR